MYYKITKDGQIVDVLSQLIFLRYQPKHDIMLTCPESEAQAVLSSDGSRIWNVSTLQPMPVEGYDSVDLDEIDEYEYAQRKMLNLQTPEDIIDAYTLSLIEGGVL